MSIDLFRILEIAKRAAQQAGETLLKEHTTLLKINYSDKRDVKIAGDDVAEDIVLSYLQKNTSYSILSEERGRLGQLKEKQYFWVVDPLDGSLNFSRGIPFCNISIGLYRSWDPVLGVVFDFHRSEMFSGIVGEGAWLNGSPIHVSEVMEKQDAVLCTGFPVNSDFTSKGLDEFIKVIQQYKKIRLLGSAALSIEYVACGRADVYRENNIMLWDVAGACAIVKAAGGVVGIEKTIKEYTAPLNVVVRASDAL